MSPKIRVVLNRTIIPNIAYWMVGTFSRKNPIGVRACNQFSMGTEREKFADKKLANSIYCGVKIDASQKLHLVHFTCCAVYV